MRTGKRLTANFAQPRHACVFRIKLMMPHIERPLEAVNNHLICRAWRSLIWRERQDGHVLPPFQQFIRPRFCDVD
jgi:hypothetical protein